METITCTCLCGKCKTIEDKAFVKKVNMLRQWLNEERIKDPNKMITTEDIKFWLE